MSKPSRPVAIAFAFSMLLSAMLTNNWPSRAALAEIGTHLRSEAAASNQVGAWREQAPYPIAIAAPAVAAHNGFIYSFGGVSARRPVTTSVTNAYKYSPLENTWTPIADLPAARSGASAVSDGTNIYVMSGWDANNHPTSTLWRYDPLANNYTALARAEYPTAGQQAIIFEGLIYRLGGASTQYYMDAETYNPVSNSWSGTWRYYGWSYSWFALTLHNGLLPAGGYPDTARTTNQAPNLPAARWGAANGWVNGRWLIAGGWVRGAASTTVIGWNPDAANDWQTLAAMPSPRYLVGGVAVDDALYVIGGYDTSRNPTTTNQAYKVVAPQPSAKSEYFPQTQHSISGRFLEYWQDHGGLAQQGYPLSDELSEVSTTDGKPYTVQYFERAVFELHPEHAPPNDVLLSLLGVYRYKQKYPEGAPSQQANPTNPRLFAETGQTIGGAFRNYWEQHGGLAQQGYPISNEFQEINDLDGKTYTVQYFERAIFEYHPENDAPFDVLLSLLGKFQYEAIHSNELTPTQTP